VSREGPSAGTVGNPNPNSLMGNYVFRHTSGRPHYAREGGCSLKECPLVRSLRTNTRLQNGPW